MEPSHRKTHGPVRGITGRLGTIGALALATGLVAPLGRVGPGLAHGSLAVWQIGDQDFHDRQSPVPIWQIRLLGAGEPPPFDGTIYGDDRVPGEMGAFEYVHRFDLWGQDVRDAALKIGLIDHDSQRGDRRGTVALFFDGVAQPTGAFRGISGRSTNGSAHVVSVPVPVDLLSDGELLVRFEAIHPARHFDGNSLQVDFSRLKIELSSDGPPGPVPAPGPQPPPRPAPVPLPAGGIVGGIMLLGGAGLALARGWTRSRDSIASPLL